MCTNVFITHNNSRLFYEIDLRTYDLLGGRNSNIVGTRMTFLMKNVVNTDLEAGILGGITITRVLSLHFGFHPLKDFSKE